VIGVLDYGLGNTGAIVNIYKRLGCAVGIVSTPDEIQSASHLVLPGVGSFDSGMELLERRGLRVELDRYAAANRPVLGICLGMQLMTCRSDEGRLPGLGWIATETKAFARDATCAGMRIPHMAWSVVTVPQENPLFAQVSGHRFWFVHGYRIADPGDAEVLATCRYGSIFIAAFRRGNLFGVQFHPEKSHRHGMRILAAFAAQDPG
jgi:glutamine amidotransferase